MKRFGSGSALVHGVGVVFMTVYGCALALALLMEPPALAQVNVVTQHSDIARTGQNTNETILTHANVNPNQFGKLFTQAVDGQIYAQPLYVANVQVEGKGGHNVVFVGTENDSVYAFDADNNSGGNSSALWHANLASTAYGAASGAVAVPYGDLSSSDINPIYGITGTPVIDPSAGTIYVVSFTLEGSNYVLRLHALNITNGGERSGSPVEISASVPGTGNGSTGGTLTFDPKAENQRGGLLLLNGVVYIPFASHGDKGPWHGWILSYNASTLHQMGAYCTTPNGTDGGVWMGGTGLAAEVTDPVNKPYGRMFFATGNGDYTASKPYNSTMDFGDSVMNLDLTNGKPTVTDLFTPDNQVDLDGVDGDQGAGGVVLMPGGLMVQTGKQGIIYLMNRNNLGGYNTGSNNVVQQLANGSTGNGGAQSEWGAGTWGAPGYWNNNVYFGGAGPYGGSGSTIKAYSVSGGKLSGSPTSESAHTFGFPGPTPSISSNGTGNGILWALENFGYAKHKPAVLWAYDATNLSSVLYNSSMNSGDTAATALKFTVPTVVNGKVYIGGAGSSFTTGVLTVYGLTGGTPTADTPVISPGSETFSTSVTVSISDSTPGAVIHYTTDGSTPDSGSPTYGGQFSVTSTETVSAIAIAPGYLQSAPTSETYTKQSGGGGSLPNYPSGFTNTGLTFNGGASVTGTILQLVDGGANETRSAYFTTPVNVQTFTNDFDFQILNPNGGGFTFIIQNQGLNAVGIAGGSGLGSHGINSSVAIKFDIFNNAGEGNDSTGVYLDGASPTVPAVDITPSGIELNSGDVIHAHMTYSGTSLTLTLTDSSNGHTFTHTFGVNIPQVVGGNTAWVGFTSATGGSTSTDDILDWTYTASGGGTPTTATPVINPGSETFSTSVGVTISDSTSGAVIHYTTDGSAPNSGSPTYGGQFTVTSTETVNAIAIAPGYLQSNEAQAVYTKQGSGGGSQPNYPSGFTTAGLTFNGGSTVQGTTLQLVDGGSNETRTAYFTTQVNVQSFTNDFDFQILNGVGGGFTFILQNQGLTAVGAAGGSALGSRTITPSVAIKFDIYNNAGEGNDSTGIYLDGASPTVPAVDITPSGIELNSGDVIHAHMTYDGANLVLTLTDGGNTFSTTFGVDIPGTVGGNTAYVGFTAATGGSASICDILDWTYVH